MSGFLKRYKITLTTQSPVFIGSGETISKKEYIRASVIQGKDGKRIVWGRQKDSEPAVYIPDMAKLYAAARAADRGEDLERYFLRGQVDLADWCSENDMQISFKGWGGYVLSIPPDVDGTLNEIQAFIKDPYGNPYVPGSSLKGMLRTIIARGLLGDRKPDRAVITDLFQKLKDANGEKLSQQLADLLRAVRISDSAPLSPGDLTVCQKIDLRTSPNMLGSMANALPTFKECLKPDVSINFTMSVDTELLAGTQLEGYFDRTIPEVDIKGKRVERSRFEVDLLSFAKKYFAYREKFKFDDYAPPRKAYVYLGGGAGFHTKTLHRPDDLHTVNSILPDNMQGHFVKRSFVAPSVLKCTCYEGKLYEMGQCAIKIEPTD